MYRKCSYHGFGWRIALYLPMEYGRFSSFHSRPLCRNLYLTVTDAAGCSKVKVCVISQNPALTLVVAAGPLSQQATANAGGGVPAYAYQWNTVPLQYAATATGLASGLTYKVKVTDSKGCTQTAVITMPTTRMEGNSLLQQITLSPNPTDGLVTLKNTGNENLSIEITDATGRIIESFNTGGRANTNIDLINKPAGIYCIHISTTINSCTFKVIKE